MEIVYYVENYFQGFHYVSLETSGNGHPLLLTVYSDDGNFHYFVETLGM